MQSDGEFRRRYGPWALVAGGSHGMGSEYTRQLARRGLSIVVLAEAAEPLTSLAREVAAEHRVETRPLVIDLSATDLLDIVARATADLEIGLLVYNAAHSVVGRFLDVSLAEKLKTLDVNCRGPLLLADHFGRRMAERRRGGIVLMSSLAGFQGQAMIGTYAATKAFSLVLGETLWDELADRGVDVLAFCPGATSTPSYLATHPRSSGAVGAPVMSAEATVAEALDRLGAGPTAIAGRVNRLAAFVLHRLLPRRTLVRVMSRTTRAMYDRREGAQ